MKNLLTETVTYKSFLGEDENYAAVYEDYLLENVAVKEKFSISEDEFSTARTAVYFFTQKSICSINGAVSALPRAKIGDLMIVGGKTYRVAEADYHENRGELSHIRFMLS